MFWWKSINFSILRIKIFPLNSWIFLPLVQEEICRFHVLIFFFLLSMNRPENIFFSLICTGTNILQFSSVQSLSRVRLFVTPKELQASLSITNSRSSPKLMCIKSVMPSSHLILCRPLLLLPPIPPSIRVFSSESALHIRWLKYWGFSFNISPSNEYPGLISFRMDWLDLLAVQGTLSYI